MRKGLYALNTYTVEAVYRESGSSVSGSKLRVFGWQWHILRRELNLPLYKATVCFLHYAAGGFLKRLR